MRRGFTIVELLIVIVVIAILAAITVVAYTGIQGRAHDTAVSSDLANYMKQASFFHAESGRYPATDTELETLGLRATKSAYTVYPDLTHNLVPCRTSSPDEFAVGAVSKSGKRLYITSGGGVQEYTGSTSWLGSMRQTAICTSILSGSDYVSQAVGYYQTSGGSYVWREWISG